MKRIVSVLLAAVLVLASACDKKTQTGAQADSRPRIILVTDATGIDDKSFNAAAWRGIVAFYGDTVENASGRGSLYDVVTCQTQDMYIPTLKQVSDEGNYDIIMATGFTFASAISEVADLYPEQKYVIVDIGGLGKPNVMEFLFTEEQGSFLVGAVAALQAKADGVSNPQFGFIGGIPGYLITKFEMGFIQGVRYISPDARIVDYYTNDWGKPELAKAQAKNWFDSGVYAIFSAAGGSGNGAIAQAKEYRIQGRDVWAIGVDSDQYADGIYSGTESAVLTSMVKLVEESSLYALNSAARNEFKGGPVVLSMAEGGVDFSDKNPALSPDVITQGEAIKEDIINGSIHVYATYREALEAGVVPADLKARDD